MIFDPDDFYVCEECRYLVPVDENECNCDTTPSNKNTEITEKARDEIEKQMLKIVDKNLPKFEARHFLANYYSKSHIINLGDI